MAGTSDKARFFLEQTVPELREWERREIFTKQEISSIAAKRSDFEHLLNARGANPADFARYAEYEINLDALRRKRVRRKGLKNTTHTGQQRIFSVLKRATKKFPGNIPLWMQYLEFAKKQKANRRVTKILTDLLRLHPTKPELWIYAARYHFDVQADISAARSHMQRGLRFCATSTSIYLEYARLEMSHLAKIYARRQVLGIDAAKYNDEQEQLQAENDDSNPDVISLAMDKSGPTSNETSEHDDFTSTPIMKGAIPLAIFDAAVGRLPHVASSIGHDFFVMFLDFDRLPCTRQLLQTVVSRLLKDHSSQVQGLNCQCRLPLAGISPQEPQFPAALRSTLAEIKSAMAQVPQQQSELASSLLEWLSPLAQGQQNLVPELQRVLQATEKQLIKTASDL